MWKLMEAYQHQLMVTAFSSDDDDHDDNHSPPADDDPENPGIHRLSLNRGNSTSHRTPCLSHDGSVLCSICIHDLEVGQSVVSLAPTCEHRFHSSCLIQWLSTHTRNCPYCRTEILTQDMLRQAYQRRNSFSEEE